MVYEEIAMNMSQYDPFTQLRALQQQFFEDDWLAPMKTMSVPTTDVYTKDDKLIVEAHLPHFDQKDIDVHVEGNALVIMAQQHEKEEDGNKKYIVRESSSSFYRRVQLPERAHVDEIEAHLDDGVLKVTVPLVALPQPKKIAVGSKAKNKK